MIVCALAAAGCPEGGGGQGGGEPQVDAAPCALTLRWGRRQEGAFVAFEEGDDAEITLGFQGFRFIDSVAGGEGTDAPEVRVRFRAEVDGQSPVTQEAGVFPLVLGPDGARYADGVLLFFNDVPMASLLDHACDVGVVATVESCTADTSVGVHLVSGPCQAPPADAGPIDGGACDAGP